MNSTSMLRPAAPYLPGLESGEFHIRDVGNHVIRSDSGETIASLVPGRQLQTELAKLPLDPTQATRAISQSGRLKDHALLLAMMHMTSSVGALASVANIGLSCVDFGVVLPRLARVEGKLDECFERLDVLERAVKKLHTNLYSLAMARLKPADDALERSLRADSVENRMELARRARDGFAESKHLYLELWKQVDPWNEPTIDVPTAIEMKNRFVTCAIGELQADFVCGDMGQFTHAARTAVRDYDETFGLDAPAALRSRCDSACADTETLARFDSHLPALSAHFRLAIGVVTYTKRRLAAFEQDADLPDQLGLEPHQVARLTRDADGCHVYALSAHAAA